MRKGRSIMFPALSHRFSPFLRHPLRQPQRGYSARLGDDNIGAAPCPLPYGVVQDELRHLGRFAASSGTTWARMHEAMQAHMVVQACVK